MLTARQRLLLKLIIEEFINTAQAVGSLNIGDKYHLDVSPATIRNEMARLSDMGLLDKSHASSGRVPTSQGIKMFLEELIEDFDDLDVVTTSKIRESLFQKRFNVDWLLSEAVSSLFRLTNNTAVAVLGGRRYTAGISEFIDQPEYRDLTKLKKILAVMEDYTTLADMFERYDPFAEVRVLVGEETGVDQFSNSAVAFARIKLHNAENGYIAVIGPNRMRYARVIPALKYIVGSIREVVQGW